MSYVEIGWEDSPSTKTPLSAENLNHMEGGIVELFEVQKNGVGMVENDEVFVVLTDDVPVVKTLLYNWDLTSSLTDTVEGFTATTTECSIGESGLTINGIYICGSGH